MDLYKANYDGYEDDTDDDDDDDDEDDDDGLYDAEIILINE